MNLSKLLFSVTLILTSYSAIGQKDLSQAKDTSDCLEINGLAIEKNVPINGVTVKLYKENEEMQWEEVTSVEYHEHSFNFNLKRNSYYTIEISKEGYVTRSIGISTKLPDNIITVGSAKFLFEFDVELFKEKKGVNDYYLDFPVALIKYNETNQIFEYDTKYTKHIKEKITETTGAISPTSVKPK
ncbi:MAG: hypothetical protein NTX97_08730 [Bacteroidetes bacterium]|nr:hypothetical protein [Bacteroidota bacterium]